MITILITLENNKVTDQLSDIEIKNRVCEVALLAGTLFETEVNQVKAGHLTERIL